MKLFKKLAAAAMAAVMSMALLTGCSGGGGGGTAPAGTTMIYTERRTLIEVNDAPYVGQYTEYIVCNGEWIYTELVMDAQTTINLSNKNGDTYLVNPKNNKMLKMDLNSRWREYDTRTTGTVEYKGKTYRTVEGTTVADGRKTTAKYCYDGVTPEYLIVVSVADDKTETWVYRIDELSDKIDESKLNLDNYTIVNSYEELYS